MTSVTVNMTDSLTGEKVQRVIDITNVMICKSSTLVIGSVEYQKKKINIWIKDRANQQHETILKLNSWELN
jgi:hypothetical protein